MPNNNMHIDIEQPHFNSQHDQAKMERLYDVTEICDDVSSGPDYFKEPSIINLMSLDEETCDDLQ